MPTVDVVIPFHDTPIAYMRQALQSVIAQTFDDWRAFVVNDGSTDASTAELRAVMAEADDARVAYIRTPNRGVSAARNSGIALGTAPYVAFLDSDDYWYPDKLERQLRPFRNQPALALTHAATDLLLDDSRIVSSPPAARAISARSPADQLERMLEANFIGLVTVVVRREALEAAGGFDESFAAIEDKELWIRLMLRGFPIAFVDEPLAVYRIHASNSSRHTTRMLEGRLRLIAKIDSLFATRGDAWPRLDWGRARRSMLAHAYHEAAEGFLEAGQFGAAWQHATAEPSGWSLQSARLAARAAFAACRRRPSAEREA